jgi:flagellar hook-associated protein 3 FlgL
MRISTLQIYSIADIGMRDAQVAIEKTHEQLTSGKRVLSSADDPVAATSILSLNQELSRTAQFKKNIDNAKSSLELEETALQSVVTLVQRLREIAVSAGNTAVLTAENYKAMAAEVDSRLGELVNLQNTRNASGQTIFAGYQSETLPFESSGGGNYIYKGDEGQLRLQASTAVTVAVSDSGKKVFMDIPSSHNTFITSASEANTASPAAIITVGQVVDQDAYDAFYPQDMQVTFNLDSAVVPAAKNYTITERTSGRILAANQLYVPGQEIAINGTTFSIFGTPSSATLTTPGDSFFIESSENQGLLTSVSRFSDAMKSVEDTPASKEELGVMVAKTLTNLQNAISHIASVQADVGARQNLLESTLDLHSDTELVGKKMLSQLQDLDYAEASTRLQLQTVVLSASQQSFVRISQLSLFTFL